jgi:glycogen phosphorylase
MESKPSLFFTDSVPRAGRSLRNQLAEHLELLLVKTRVTATEYDYYQALSLAVKDRLVRKWLRTQHTYRERDAREVYYLSMEFLMGRLLATTLINLDFYDECRSVLLEEKLVLEDLMEQECDMGLGNGGLGRLAACFLDSMATLRLPAFGYGIRYEYGIFRQEIRDGYQIEQPDNWLRYGNPWETLRKELTYRVQFRGRIASSPDPRGGTRYRWLDTDDVLAVAYDIPVPGYKSNTVNNLRLWRARSTEEFSFSEFDRGNYLAAVEDKNLSENISKVLYPNDSSVRGKALRLQQEYFFVSASLQDILHKYYTRHGDLTDLAEKIFVQLNDTHPVIAIPELMRLLMDEQGQTWDKAWAITSRCFGYTNHTVVPEALEEWSIDLLEELLPRHLQIIYEINQRFLDQVRAEGRLDARAVEEVSIIREAPTRTVRMANLAMVAAVAVNGVAELHTEILRKRVFPHFYQLYPEKFHAITNGVTPRRWLVAANPLLSEFITERLGSTWITDLDQLRELEHFIDDEAFRAAWAAIKKSQKVLLKRHIEQEMGISVDLNSMFDTQVKRIHLYKRQLLNLLHVITLYRRILADPDRNEVARTVIFAGKAAPAYQEAKLVIKLINSVAARVNENPAVNRLLRVLFLPNYSVSLAETIIPATDLSEQISTAGFEASGTGNMKFALNGALTIGTLDGANIEIRDEVGADNMFIFGMTSDEVIRLKEGGYRPSDFVERSPELRESLDLIGSGHFAPNEPGIFAPLVDELLERDYYCVLADFDAYLQKQEEAAALYRDDEKEWVTRSIRNVARMGRFSSDFTIRRYNEKIWRAEPVEIPEERLGMI